MPELTPDYRLSDRVREASGVNTGACFACKKCSNGCPLTFAMDYHPFKVVRFVQLGQMDRLKECRTVWVCSSCQTCVTRCPNDVDLPRLMDWIKENIVLEGKPAAEDKVKIFHQAFLKEVKARGRVFEGGLMMRYMLESGAAFGPEAFKNAKLGLTMLRKGRMKLLPGGTKDRKWLKELVRETSRK